MSFHLQTDNPLYLQNGMQVFIFNEMMLRGFSELVKTRKSS